MVERDEPSHDAERIPQGEVERIVLRGRQCLAAELERQPGEVAQLVGGHQVVVAHHGDGAAVVQRVEPGQFLAVGQHDVGQGREGGGAFGDGGAGPWPGGCLGCFYRVVHVTGVAQRDLGNDRFVAGMDDGHGFTRPSDDEFAADQHLPRPVGVRGDLRVHRAILSRVRAGPKNKSYCGPAGKRSLCEAHVLVGDGLGL
jgi:hypothetical protein